MTHGMSDSPTYTSWKAMKRRCKQKHRKMSKYYRDRGITYVSKWEKFESFFFDMGQRPYGKTLDRIDNTLGYNKENCRWATRRQQVQNRGLSKTKNRTSRFKGVSISKRYKKVRWRAVIKYNEKIIHIGYFMTEIEAAEAYNNRAGEYFGEFAYLNTIERKKRNKQTQERTKDGSQAYRDHTC